MSETELPSITVVLATYNGARFLKALLASLEAQSYRPAEIIIGDDGSTDATIELCEAFAKSSAIPVRLIRNPVNLGYGENFLSAASQAKTPYIAFCDQDDVWAPSKLDVCARTIARTGAVMVAHAAELIDGEGALTGTFDQGITTYRLMAPNSMDPWGVFLGFSIVFKASLLQLAAPSARGQDGHQPEVLLAHDRWIYTLANAHGPTALLPDRLVKYRQHGANVFGAPHAEAARMIMAQARELSATRALRYESIAEHRARLFEKLAQACADHELARQWQQAFRMWDTIRKNESERRLAYSLPTIWKRWAKVVANVQSEVYACPARKQLRWRALAKDVYTCSHLR